MINENIHKMTSPLTLNFGPDVARKLIEAND
jgi:hypothetical protein